MTQVFLSHSTTDATFAEQLATDLREVGIPVWKAPESIQAGEDWLPAIMRGLRTSSHMLLLMSPAAVTSKWVNYEFNIALHLRMQDKMSIIPVEYEPCEMPLAWVPLQAIMGFGANYDSEFRTLLRRLNTQQPPHPPPPADPTTTINITIEGSVSGSLNVAGRDLNYEERPTAPPPVEAAPPEIDIEAEVDALRELSEEDQWDAMINRATALIEQGHKHDELFFYRGFAYDEKGDVNTAITDLTTAIHLDSSNANTYINRGLAYFKQHNLEAAIADLTNALRLTPDNVNVYVNRGWAYYQQGKLDAAIADYDAAWRLDPDDVLIYANRGFAYRQKGDYEAAIAAFTQANGLAAAHYNDDVIEGLRHEKQGDLAQANALYQRAIDAHHPDADELRRWIADNERKMRDE